VPTKSVSQNEQTALARGDLDTATALLTARHVAGDARLAAEVIAAEVLSALPIDEHGDEGPGEGAGTEPLPPVGSPGSRAGSFPPD
jgi:hypothetical protein